MVKLFARDSMLWQILFYGGIAIVALSMAPDAVIQSFPLWVAKAMPTFRLIAFVLLAVGGKMGLSWFDAAPDGQGTAVGLKKQ